MKSNSFSNNNILSTSTQAASPSKTCNSSNADHKSPAKKYEPSNASHKSPTENRKSPGTNRKSPTPKHDPTTDRRFIASEQKLKSILLEMARAERGISFSVTEFCNRGDFNRRTFYRHYSSVAQLISCQIAAHQSTIKTLATELFSNSLSHEVNLYKILFFISKHKDDYAASLARANFALFHTLAISMKPLVFREWGIAEPESIPIENPQLDKKYMDFSFEVIANLVWWVQSEGAEKSEIPNLVNRIMGILRRYGNN